MAALLRYLPYGGQGPLAEDVWWSLDALTVARPKADPAVAKALADPVAVRRCAVPPFSCLAPTPRIIPAVAHLQVTLF